MTIQTNPSGLKTRLDAANPNDIADAFRLLGIGTILRRQRTPLRRQNPNAQAAGVASLYDLATLQVIFLPDDAKASTIHRAFARATAAAGTLGELTVEPFGTTPADAQIAVTPCGNIAVLGASQYSDVDIEYDVAHQDVVEIVLPCVAATGVCALPAALAGTAGMGTPATVAANVPNYAPNPKGVLNLLEAEVLAGTATGKKIVLVPTTGAPAAGRAQLDVPKANVRFAVADGATQVRLKLGVVPGIDINALLEGASAVL